MRFFLDVAPLISALLRNLHSSLFRASSFWWIEAELKQAIQQSRPVMKVCGRNFAQQVQILLRRRHGSDPEIERLGRAWEEQRVSFERQADE